MSKRV
jgi:hypothetical protein